jgi:hypothetical protein
MIDRQEARSDVARIDPAADRWLHTANRARATRIIYQVLNMLLKIKGFIRYVIEEYVIYFDRWTK